MWKWRTKIGFCPLSLALLWKTSKCRIRKRFLKEKEFPQFHWANWNPWFHSLDLQNFSQLFIELFLYIKHRLGLVGDSPSSFSGTKPHSLQLRFCCWLCLQISNLRREHSGCLSLAYWERKEKRHLRRQRVAGSPTKGPFLDRNRIIATRTAFGWHFSGWKLTDHIENRRILLSRVKEYWVIVKRTLQSLS